MLRLQTRTVVNAVGIMACVWRTFNQGIVFLVLALLSHQRGVHPFRPPPRPHWWPVGVPQRLGAGMLDC